MLAGLATPPSNAGQLTTQAPLATAAAPTPAAPSPELPSGPDLPLAHLVTRPGTGHSASVDSNTQGKIGDVYTLDGNVVLHYGDRTVEADHVEYDDSTAELTATGHLHLSGGTNSEEIHASHGHVNLATQVGAFYDVTGSVGLKPGKASKLIYANGNPFLFSGREVRKTGPENYVILGGTVTSCLLPRPDWLLSAGTFTMDDSKVRGHNSVFHLLNLPVLYLPYVTQPVNTTGRQSGFLIPVIGQSSTKGTVLGEQIYLAINRSTDITLGAEYFSLRGWLDQFTFRNRGLGDNFVQAHFSQLFDRGYTPKGGTYTNQGGEDFVVSARRDLSPSTRLAADVEYLSSYIYREAFTENFNQAVSTDILSDAFAVTTRDGYTASLEADRYQGLKRVAIAATDTAPAIPSQEIRLFHVPALELSSTDRALRVPGLTWNFDAQAAGLKRVQPDFATGGVTERLDLHPSLSYGLSAAGWRLRPSLAGRETLYSRSVAPFSSPTGAISPPVEQTAGVSRSNLEATLDLRAPVIERVFDTPIIERLARGPVKHTVEPFLEYRFVTGVNNFQSILRFDDRDVVSNTNELEYGVTQRLFVRSASRNKGCGASAVDLDVTSDTDAATTDSTETATSGDPVPTALGSGRALPGIALPPNARCTTREWISWTLAQKSFFNPTFGGAVVSGRRNILSSTLDLSGVAFLTEPRNISPLVSRLQLRSSQFVDLEWDFDLDTGAKKFTSNNILIDVHRGVTFAGLSYARLNAPGRSYVEGVNSLTSDFDQMRLLAGYGSPTKAGLSVAANAGLDLDLTQIQYAALQTSYNWNCCGLSVEYRKYELGSVRNENAYRFNFTLANIGTAGNLRRAERLF